MLAFALLSALVAPSPEGAFARTVLLPGPVAMDPSVDSRTRLMTVNTAAAPRRVVVFVPGFNTQLAVSDVRDLATLCTDEREDPVFGHLKAALIAQGFPYQGCRGFLNYSYNGTTPPDVEDGLFIPAPYVKDQSAQRLADSVDYLGAQLVTYQQRAVPVEPLEFVLVGHSLGGVVALDYATRVAEAREQGGGHLFPNVIGVMTVHSPVLGISPDDWRAANKEHHFPQWSDALVPDMRDFAMLIAGNCTTSAARCPAAEDLTARWATNWSGLVQRLAGRGIASYTTGSLSDCVWRPWECEIPREFRMGLWLDNWDARTRNVQQLSGSDGPLSLPGGDRPCTAAHGAPVWVGAPTDPDAHLDDAPLAGFCINARHSAVLHAGDGDQTPALAAWIRTLPATPIPSATPSPTSVPSATPTSAPTVTATAGTPGPCPRRGQGDASCDGSITLADYTIWRNQFLGTDPARTADFNGDGRITLADYTIWRNSFLASQP